MLAFSNFCLFTILQLLSFVFCSFEPRSNAFVPIDIKIWASEMEHLFVQRSIPEHDKVDFAIGNSMGDHTELQNVMRDRQRMYERLGDGKPWMWDDFLLDLTRIAERANHYGNGDPFVFPSSISGYKAMDKTFSAGTALSYLDSIKTAVEDAVQSMSSSVPQTVKHAESGIHDIVGSLEKTIDSAKEDISNTFKGFVGFISGPPKENSDSQEFNVASPPSTLSPVPTVERSGAVDTHFDLSNSLHDLERSIGTLLGGLNLEDVFNGLQEFVSSAITLVTDEVKKAIALFEEFRHEHPYITAAVSTSLIAFGTLWLLPEVELMFLRLFGFAAEGPIAGSWAAAVQSTFYGGRTGGLFSVIQSITMTARNVWPIKVFLNLALIAFGAAVFPPEAIKESVDSWIVDMPLPEVSSLLNQDYTVDYGFKASEELGSWMIGLGQKCQEAGVPEAQWLDVAFQFLTKTIENINPV